jgi:hypothetical protein
MKDSSGNGRDAQLLGSGGASLGVPGVLAGDPDTALELAGGQALDCGDLFDFPGRIPYSFELWVRPKASDGFMIFDKMVRGASGVPVSGSIFYYDPPRLGLERWTSSDAGNYATQFVDDRNASVPAAAFTHVVLTYDGGNARIFTNGVLLVTGPGSGADIADTTKAFRWGDGLTGILDELAVYDVALSPARVAAHYAAAR